MKPRPIKAILGQSDLSNILFCQAQVIKKLKAEIAAKNLILVDVQRHSKGISLEMESHASRIKGIVDKWQKGVLSLKDIE